MNRSFTGREEVNEEPGAGSSIIWDLGEPGAKKKKKKKSQLLKTVGKTNITPPPKKGNTS